MPWFYFRYVTMLTLLSPAKKLLKFDQPYSENTTQPIFAKQTAELIQLMKKKSIAEIARLMHLSDDLAELNYHRYQAFRLESCPASQSYPAIYLFQGDVYQQLQAQLWDKKTLDFSQTHLAILSGLYGLLKPLDSIQCYRLEMGTRLANSCGNNLYDFWQSSITEALNQQLAHHTNPVLVNLASTEYFGAVNTHQLKAPLVTIHFKERKGNQLKVIGIHAKKARGAMANFICQHQIDNVEKIKSFTVLNYHYCDKSSDSEHFNFIRQ